MTDGESINGIDGHTGQYGPTPSFDELVTLARNEAWSADYLDTLRELYDQTRLAGTLAPRDKVLVTDLSQTGWGVIFAPDIDPVIKQALAPLLALRRSQATRYDQTLYQEFTYRQNQTKSAFLHAHGANETGPAELPYYLLIVGDPLQIPYRFQYELDVEYAVGRIYFSTSAEYTNYAHAVVEAEQSSLIEHPQATFFAPHHTLINKPPDFTEYSAYQLVSPLIEKLKQRYKDWAISSAIAQEATKARLSQFLGGEQTPNLLFTATHGVTFPDGDVWQLEKAGGPDLSGFQPTRSAYRRSVLLSS
jgi:hypothetical protein